MRAMLWCACAGGPCQTPVEPAQRALWRLSRGPCCARARAPVPAAATQARARGQLFPYKDLQALRMAFHKRYKLTFGTSVEPSDAVLSRLYREIGKRVGKVHDVLKTKTLTHTYMERARSACFRSRIQPRTREGGSCAALA